MTAAPPPHVWALYCPNCRRVFGDIWAYKRHQDDARDPCNRVPTDLE